MEPLIPVNVIEEMVSESDISSMVLSLNGPSPSLQHENAHSTLSHEEAIAVVGRLSQENRQLKGNLQQANLAMKNAYDLITKLKENDDKKEREIDRRCTQAREKIETLRQTVADRDKTIENLRAVQVCQQESSNKQLTKLKEELQKLEQLSKHSNSRSTDNVQLVQNLRTHAQTLDKSLQMEKERNRSLQEQFSQLQRKHEQLLSDYHDLLVETDKKAEKQGDIAAMKNDYDQRLDNLTAQLLASEDVLGSKDNQIQSLHQRVKDYDGLKKQLTQQQQEIEALQAQASVYKVDFEAERKSREELNDERLNLQEQLIVVQEELQAAKVANQMVEMQLRQGYVAGPRPLNVRMAEATPVGDVRQQGIIAQEHSQTQGAAAAAAAAPTTTAVPAETQPVNRTTETMVFFDADLKCPICNHIAPDIDSLQLHCNDCIQ